MCVVPPDLQGVSWYISVDEEEEGGQEPSPSDPGQGPRPEDDEPLYAVPRKEHHHKFTLDNFVLHKMLGKGSFGKVAQRPPLLGLFDHRIWLSTYGTN